jgi:hypothetical protein
VQRHLLLLATAAGIKSRHLISSSRCLLGMRSGLSCLVMVLSYAQYAKKNMIFMISFPLFKLCPNLQITNCRMRSCYALKEVNRVPHDVTGVHIPLRYSFFRSESYDTEVEPGITFPSSSNICPLRSAFSNSLEANIRVPSQPYIFHHRMHLDQC